eukprot:902927-Pelagomonas_calceolata.AAC.1
MTLRFVGAGVQECAYKLRGSFKDDDDDDFDDGLQERQSQEDQAFVLGNPEHDMPLAAYARCMPENWVYPSPLHPTPSSGSQAAPFLYSLHLRAAGQTAQQAYHATPLRCGACVINGVLLVEMFSRVRFRKSSNLQRRPLAPRVGQVGRQHSSSFLKRSHFVAACNVVHALRGARDARKSRYTQIKVLLNFRGALRLEGARGQEWCTSTALYKISP